MQRWCALLQRALKSFHDAASNAGAQIEKYRAMTGEERLKPALDLHELSREIARDGIRCQHPEASGDEVERLLRSGSRWRKACDRAGACH
jgi:hypothetical protein